MATLNKQLAAPGTVGNNTHTLGEDVDAERVAFQINVSAVGATPTATFQIQGSIDNVNWYNLPYITPASATEAATAFVLTAVGQTLAWLMVAGSSRFFKRYRVVVTANTNVTYDILMSWTERPE